MLTRLLTIGVYTFTLPTFLAALNNAKVDCLIDIRLRRAVRGRTYAFANAKRLQAALANAGIRYEHALELAPTRDMLKLQHAIDAKGHVPLRQREVLSDQYIKRYASQILARLDVQAFLDTRIRDARRPALLCVEANPAACHRSLAANYLAARLDIPVKHLRP